MAKKHFNPEAAMAPGKIREKDVEEYLVVQTKKRLGGHARKYNSPGRAAEPDRLLTWAVALPVTAGLVVFVEAKAPGKKPTPAQLKAMNHLRADGQLVYWVDSKGAVDRLLDGLELL